MSNKTLKPVVLAASAVMLGSVALSGSAFAMSPLPQGYLLAAASAGEKAKEGSCGADHAGHEHEEKAGEGRCGEGRCGEGACGEGSCGAADGSDGKEAEGRCGEGTCGAHHGEAAESTDGEEKADAEGTCNG